ncbi:DNA/RNA helicase domain-containing protein [Deinococcus hopiensis]|uniref:DNA/RNA helicase domain-containing protein n=1 Tax=Deinococcus hopiensis TaxID=309885 RepID=UPI003CCBA6EF
MDGDGAWNSPTPRAPTAGRRAPENPHQLRLNSYRVLLSRGRDGLILYVPQRPTLDVTYAYFQARSCLRSLK